MIPKATWCTDGPPPPNAGTPKVTWYTLGGCGPQKVKNTEIIGHTTAKNKTTGLEETPNRGETLGGKWTDELTPPPKPEEATTPPDTPKETTKAMKSTSPKNAPTRNW